MRTHLGNPSQTFAALEQLLQGMLSRLNSAGPDPSQAVADSIAPLPQLYSVPASRSSSAAPLLEPSWMLLELMHALEKNMYSAYAGSCLRPMALASAAIAFYKSNRKVQEVLASLLTCVDMRRHAVVCSACIVDESTQRHIDGLHWCHNTIGSICAFYDCHTKCMMLVPCESCKHFGHLGLSQGLAFCF